MKRFELIRVRESKENDTLHRACDVDDCYRPARWVSILMDDSIIYTCDICSATTTSADVDDPGARTTADLDLEDDRDPSSPYELPREEDRSDRTWRYLADEDDIRRARDA